MNDSFEYDEEVEDSGNEENSRPDNLNETYVQVLEDEGKDDNVMKILVATDIHCGYAENKSHRTEDSVNTFEEILQIALKKKVDFILLGGDLFHENQPSRKVLNQVTHLLRKYCLNDNEVRLQYLSDPSTNFAGNLVQRVNFEDENFNVGLPIFTIHGNHDDMTGCGQTALDSLHESGLLNLFGKYESIEKFDVAPVLLTKGTTKLALFGIGSQRDDRISRYLEDGSLQFLRPEYNEEDWFNLLVLHQNRPTRNMDRTTGASVPERLLPNFMDLVVWGHEHECIPTPKFVASSTIMGDGFYILQPGSSIATSLTEPEAVEKNVFYMKIKGRKFTSKPIPLKTVRPLVLDSLLIDEFPRELINTGKRPAYSNGTFYDENEVIKKLESMLQSAEKRREKTDPWPPLLRLTVNYSSKWDGFKRMNGRKVAKIFAGKVANPTELLVVKRISCAQRKAAKVAAGMEGIQPLGAVTRSTMEEVINQYFKKQTLKHKLGVFTSDDLNKAIAAYKLVETNGLPAARAHRDFVASLRLQKASAKEKLMEMPFPELVENGKPNFKKFDAAVKKDFEAMKRAYYEKLGEVGTGTSETENLPPSQVKEEEDDDEIEEVPVTTTKRKLGRPSTKRK